MIYLIRLDVDIAPADVSTLLVCIEEAVTNLGATVETQIVATINE